MIKKRIVIVDTDVNYIIPLQLKFAEEFFDSIDLEIISDKYYYNSFFSEPQKIDILIIAEDLYDSSIQRHNIGNLFLMTEQYEEDEANDININKIFKYTSIKEIFNEIVGNSPTIFGTAEKEKFCQVIVVCSASGGVGKTTVSLGICEVLTKNYKRVLYVNASRLQTFQHFFENKTPISNADVYANFLPTNNDIYTGIKHIIRKEIFYYLPPFKSALMSLGISYKVFSDFITSAKESTDFDYIVVDTDNALDKEQADLINIADKTIIVTTQTKNSVYSTNLFVSNLNRTNKDKYIFVCNAFEPDKDNALVSSADKLKFTANEYIEYISNYDANGLVSFSKQNGIQKTALLVL